VHGSPFCIIAVGNPIPDCTGSYISVGVYNDHPLFKCLGKSFWMWWDTPEGYYFLSDRIGWLTDCNSWQPESINLGTYWRYTAVGNATGYFASWPPHAPWIDVTGDPDPDCTGHYTQAAVIDDRPSWRNASETWELYSHAATDQYRIRAVPDVPGSFWETEWKNFENVYNPTTYTGNPIVSVPDVR